MKKLTCITGLFLTLLFYQKSYAQVLNPNASSGGGYSGYDGAPTHQDLDFTTGFGTSGYQMALHDPNGDLDILTPTSGYMIGLNPVLYTGGDPTSIFVGEQIGLTYTLTTEPQYNTCVGYETAPGINASTDYHSSFNTISGAFAGNSLTTGYNDTYYGAYAGYSDQDGAFNIFIGYQAGYSNTGGAGPVGDFNVMTGFSSGYWNTTGKANDYYGKGTGYNNNGNYNCIYGNHAGYGFASYSDDSEAFFGSYAGYNIAVGGNNNVLIGNSAGYNMGKSDVSNFNTYVGGRAGFADPGGNYNVALGFGADVAHAPGGSAITNAAAIGAEVDVNYNNQLILGNNSQFVGIGESSDYPNGGPGWNLEICTEHNPHYGMPGLGGGIFSDPNPYAGTGFSGLKFRDLTSYSSPVDPGNANFDPDENPYPTGLLSVDGAGNVIYVNSTSLNPLGTCSSPLTPSAGNDPTIDLGTNQNNFWFSGQGTSSPDLTNVIIGSSCSTSLPVKLFVSQASGATSTTYAGVFKNVDASAGYNTTRDFGIVASVPSTIYQSDCIANIAGFFTATGALNPDECGQDGGPILLDYALYVPPNGGGVNIGYAYGSPYTDPTQLLIVNSNILAAGITVFSDSILKSNVASFTHGLDVIRKMQPVSYNYNGKGGIDTVGTHYGVIAQALNRIAPYAVTKTSMRLDTSLSTESSVMKIDENAVVYTAINAIKQLDSSTTAHQNTDSVKLLQQQRTIDSLVNALASIQNCLNTLCGGSGDAPVHHSTGNGNSGDSNSSITNVQEVMLSAATNAPLLYQNIPNPFSTGTKINYYLPQGTVGAIVVFYDTYGNQIKTVPLSQTGNGTLNITPDNLSAGIYSYSLIVNNSVIDTKRMLLQK